MANPTPRCNVLGHKIHEWPPLSNLAEDLEILPCERYCQWCSPAKKFDTAATLRKHAVRHIDPDSEYGVLRAEKKGGPMSLAEKNKHMQPKEPVKKTPKIRFKPVNNQSSSAHTAVNKEPAVKQEEIDGVIVNTAEGFDEENPIVIDDDDDEDENDTEDE